MASTPVRPSPLSPFESANSRQSPFRRQGSVSPATVRATPPATSPTKQPSNLSPLKNGSLSPEKTSPFVRRPSQMNQNAGRPSSPFARPSSSLSITSSPTRKSPEEPIHEEDFANTSVLRTSRQPSVTPVSDEDEPPSARFASPNTPTLADSNKTNPAPSLRSPATSPTIPSQASLRPVAQRTTLPSTTMNFAPASPSSTIIAAPKKLNFATNSTPKPLFSAAASPAAGNLSLGVGLVGGGGSYTHLPPALLHSMRESFEVLDSSNSGTVNSAALAEMLSQLNLANDPASLSAFFPPNGPAQLNLARYLDTLSGPLGEMSAPEELRAAFEAFDLDDSGQVDLGVLREALLRSTGEDGVGMGEREVDAVLGEFSGRRAFGMGKGGKGDVFRYRDFMASFSTGGIGAGPGDAQGVFA